MLVNICHDDNQVSFNVSHNSITNYTNYQYEIQIILFWILILHF